MSPTGEGLLPRLSTLAPAFFLPPAGRWEAPGLPVLPTPWPGFGLLPVPAPGLALLPRPWPGFAILSPAFAGMPEGLGPDCFLRPSSVLARTSFTGLLPLTGSVEGRLAILSPGLSLTRLRSLLLTLSLTLERSILPS